MHTGPIYLEWAGKRFAMASQLPPPINSRRWHDHCVIQQKD